MFDDIFGPKAKASAAVDAYLERMERAMRLKHAAHRVGEDAISGSMDDLLKKLIDLTSLEIVRSIDALKESDSKSSEANDE
jgi:hypothetical protein